MSIDDFVKSLNTELGSSDSNEFDKTLEAVRKSECLAELSANAASFLAIGNYTEAKLRLQDTLAIAFMAGRRQCE